MPITLRVSKNISGLVILPVPGLNPLQANQIFTLSDEDYENNYIQGAIKNGFLTYYVDDILKDAVADEVKVVDKVEEKEVVKPELTEVKKTVVKENELLDIYDDVDRKNEKSNIMSWDIENQKMLNKEESAKKLFDNLKPDPQSTVKVGKDIDFSDDIAQELSKAPEVVVDEEKVDDVLVDNKPEVKVAKKLGRPKKEINSEFGDVEKEENPVKKHKGKKIEALGDVKPEIKNVSEEEFDFEVKPGKPGDVEFLDI